MGWTKHLMYILVIILLQKINFKTVEFTQHKSEWCDGFYKKYTEGL